ncbi:hypothetical protein [Azospirillum sp. SYSU D00513]|uniref:hypothetical protein n=1 Tax=Azospirillum sp. SYSU D00513 TaxID=2812561 RepID=UPI001A971260|nr:hypothetical protein [Azospirillum sp. SYSU D00513]
MRRQLWLAAIPALMFGLAACDEQTAENNQQSTSPSVAEQPATMPSGNTAPQNPPASLGTTPTAPAGSTSGSGSGTQ